MKLKITSALFAVLLSASFAPKAQAQIHVSQFGALPDDGVDDILAIRNAIAALPAGNGFLEFSPGVYDLNPTTILLGPAAATAPNKVIFSITNKMGLIVEGNGATFLCHEFDPTMSFDASYYDLFGVTNSTDVEIRNFTVNMSRLPFTIGICTQTNWNVNVSLRKFRTLISHPDFGIPGTGMSIQALVNWRNGLPNGQRFFYRQQKPIQAFGSDFFVSNLSSAVYDIQGRWTQPLQLPADQGFNMMSDLPNPASPSLLDYGRLAVGDDVVIAHQVGHYAAFRFQDCTRSILSNLTVHSWPGRAVDILRDQDLLIDGLQVLPDPQRQWLVSTTSEAIRLVDCRGGVQVQGGTLKGMLDAGLHAYSDLLQPLPFAWTNTTMQVLAVYPGTIFPAGSQFEFYDINMQPMGTRTLSIPSTNLAGNTLHMLTFTSNLPTPTASVAYLCNLSQSPVTDVNGVTVLANRGNGFQLRKDSTVFGCTFVDVSGSGIEIGPSVGPIVGNNIQGPNFGPGGGNVLIEGSNFEYCNRGSGLADYGEGTVNIQASRWAGSYVGAARSSLPWGSGLFLGITLRNLTLLNSGGAAVATRTADLLTIDSCSFGSGSDLGNLLTPNNATAGFGQYAGESLLYAHQAGNVSIINNQVLPGSAILNGDRTWPLMFGSYTKVGNVGF